MRARSEGKEETKKGKLEKPADHYKSPDDIVKDKDLSPAEKRQALNTWEQDARQMLTASNEGMEGGRKASIAATVIGSARWFAPRIRSALSQSASTRTSVAVQKSASFLRAESEMREALRKSAPTP